jgi:2-polyprenyl-6-methoxyphenol hydroxylase-like FAD-dependent oxidoreductase
VSGRSPGSYEWGRNMTNTAASNVDVVIIGGGIGGLAAGYALASAGHTVRLLERAQQFGEVGAGLQLAPNATRILAEWGLLDEVVDAGMLPGRLVLADVLTGQELLHLNLGDAFRERYHAPYVVVHRSDVHRILLDACRCAGVELLTGRTAERVETVGAWARTYCADGEVYKSAVVLAADGLSSTLRRSVVDDDLICSGYVAYRGPISITDVHTEVNLTDVVAWIGPGCHFVQYALRRGEVINQVAVFGSPAFARGDAEWGGPAELDDAFAGSCDHVRTALPSLWRDRWWPMYDRLPARQWVSGRLALIGDAAHPMLQYLAQGACQALEDAHSLATESAKAGGAGTTDWDAALAGYVATRAPRAGRVQTAVRVWGDIWHVNGVGALLRNELFASLTDLYRYTDWLYAL